MNDSQLWLDIGSGHVRMQGYKRVDVDAEAQPDYLIRAEDLADHFEHGTVDKIHAAHVLEHISPSDCFSTLHGWWKVLRPGGELHLVVPDVKTAARHWLDGDADDCCFVNAVLGSDPDATPYMVHRNVFWRGKLHRFLNITGYDIRSSGYVGINVSVISIKPEEE